MRNSNAALLLILLVIIIQSCYTSDVCVEEVNAPVNALVRQKNSGEIQDAVLNNWRVSGQGTDSVLTTSQSQIKFFMQPDTASSVYEININDSILSYMYFYYTSSNEYYSDACGFSFEYLIDSVSVQQATDSAMVNFYDTLFIQITDNNGNITGIDTLIDTNRINTYVPRVIDSVHITNRNIQLNSNESNIEIFLRSDFK